jgi:hypothetical protein
MFLSLHLTSRVGREIEVRPSLIVTLGLDPRVHFFVWAPHRVDARVKPGHDGDRVGGL